MTDGNTYAIDHYLLEREDYDQREENDAELFNLRCEVDVLTGMLADLHDAQTYTYIGKNGKPVLARDLEARAEAAEARIAHLENHIESVAKDTHGIMLQYEAALPAKLMARINEGEEK